MRIFLFNFLLQYKKKIIFFFFSFLIIFFYFESKKLKISTQINQILPQDHPISIQNENFKKIFGENNGTIVISVNRNWLYQNRENFEKWENLREKIATERVINKEKNQINPYQWIISETHLPLLKFKEEKFELSWIDNQNTLEKIKNTIDQYPFYKGFLYSDTSKNQEKEEISLIFIQIKSEIINSELRGNLIENIEKHFEKFKEEIPQTHISGLGFIRIALREQIKKEVNFFVVLSILIMSLVIFLFFRSIKILLLCLSIIGTSIVFGLALIGFLDYQISAIMGLMPSLLTVISIPNCIYFIHHFSNERKKEPLQTALKNTFFELSFVNLITNLSTALGFFVFITTNNQILSEFGIVTGISILFLYLSTMILMSLGLEKIDFVAEKKFFLDQLLEKIIQFFINFKIKKDFYLYLSLGFLLLISLIGISKIEKSISFTDDLSKENKIKKDLLFFEKHFNGIIPIDILIQTQGKHTKEKALLKIENVQNSLNQENNLSKSISLVDFIKYSHQAFYEGDKESFSLFPKEEMIFLEGILRKQKTENKQGFQFILDSTQQKTRISFQIKEEKTDQIEKTIQKIKEIMNQFYNEEEYFITGTAISNSIGTDYLIKNLFSSLLLSILLIAFIVFLLFRSIKITLISVLPNLIPLILTAACIGFFEIPLKTTTLLIFSIVLGISIDDSIHFLSKYKLEKRENKIEKTLLKTGKSIITTSIILFIGFIIFTLSSFKSTFVLGLLISITLFLALISNLILLPYLLKKI